jgi:glutaminyl-peptide cyclotransferase
VAHQRRTPIVVASVCALLAVAAIAVVALASGRPERRPERRVVVVHTDRFDANRAWAELRRQVELGPRPAGSPQLRTLAQRLRDALPNGRFEPVPGHAGLRNVTGRVPGKRPAILVAAHYDTKDLPGFVGANDGAAGTAAVLELARVLRKLPREREIRFALFDGEEATDDRRPFLATGLRGSRAYARRHGEQIGAMVLLDFIAADPLKIRREANSDPRLWKVLRAAARRAGAADAFPGGTIGAITDDHTPFLLQGVPAIDLIAWPYPCWHRSCDNLESVDRRSLGKSGAAVLELVRTLAG